MNEKGTDDAYRLLAYAIIAQAATDYMECMKFMMYTEKAKQTKGLEEMREYVAGQIHINEAFFTSQRFDLLADKDVDGIALMETLKKRAWLQWKNGRHSDEQRRDNFRYIGRMAGRRVHWKEEIER